VVEEQKELQLNSTSSLHPHASKAQKSQRHAERERNRHTNRPWLKNIKKVELNPSPPCTFMLHKNENLDDA
jgi:hypothetical protein